MRHQERHYPEGITKGIIKSQRFFYQLADNTLYRYSRWCRNLLRVNQVNFRENTKLQTMKPVGSAVDDPLSSVGLFTLISFVLPYFPFLIAKGSRVMQDLLPCMIFSLLLPSGCDQFFPSHSSFLAQPTGVISLISSRLPLPEDFIPHVPGGHQNCDWVQTMLSMVMCDSSYSKKWQYHRTQKITWSENLNLGFFQKKAKNKTRKFVGQCFLNFWIL